MIYIPPPDSYVDAGDSGNGNGNVNNSIVDQYPYMALYPDIAKLLGEGIFNKNQSNTDWNSIEGYMKGLFSSLGETHSKSMAYNSLEAKYNRQFQHDEAELQRNWYEEMSNTAYQRAMADMKKAGLNPILAYSQGGAATSATGVTAGSAASVNSPGGDTFTSVISAVADLLAAASGSAYNIGKLLKFGK